MPCLMKMLKPACHPFAFKNQLEPTTAFRVRYPQSILPCSLKGILLIPKYTYSVPFFIPFFFFNKNLIFDSMHAKS